MPFNHMLGSSNEAAQQQAAAMNSYHPQIMNQMNQLNQMTQLNQMQMMNGVNGIQMQVKYRKRGKTNIFTEN